MYKLTKIQHIWSKGKSTNLAKKKRRKEALKHNNNKISSKATQQNSIISSIHQMREREREKKKKKTSWQLRRCFVFRPLPSVVLSASLRALCARALCIVDGVMVAPWPWIRGGVDPWDVVLPFSFLWRRIWQRIELVCVVCAIVQGDFWIGNVGLGVRD